MKPENYVWITLDSFDGERSLKQHCFIPTMSKGGNERNKSLCGNVIAGNDEGKSAIFETLYERDEPIKGNACKACLRLFNQ